MAHFNVAGDKPHHHHSNWTMTSPAID